LESRAQYYWKPLGDCQLWEKVVTEMTLSILRYTPVSAGFERAKLQQLNSRCLQIDFFNNRAAVSGNDAFFRELVLKYTCNFGAQTA
jgi:hypothetical protein